MIKESFTISGCTEKSTGGKALAKISRKAKCRFIVEILNYGLMNFLSF